jgi:hypothetical protein
VGRLAGEEKLPAPALMIVGRVASREVQQISKSFWNGEADKQQAMLLVS